MARYLICASYTSDGIRGVIKGGGTARRDAVGKTVADLGGRMETFDFAFDKDDAYVIVDLPDNVSAAALGLAVGASGMARTRTIVLLTPEEIDRAAATPVAYRAPGQ